MKLHLPTKLLSAVMALYVSQAALSTAWAEGDNTYTIKGDVTYGYEGDPWTGTTPKWTYVDGEHVLNDGINSTFTSEDEKEHSVTFNGKGGEITETAIVGTTVTIENLKEINFTQFETGSYAIFSKDLTIQNNGKFSVSDNVNTERGNYYSYYYIGGEHILIDNNDEVSLVNNKVFSGEFDEAGNAISGGDSIDGGVIKNYSGDNHLLTTISNNELINISNNSIISAGNTVSGGAIYSEGPILLENNGDISIVGNIAESRPVNDGAAYHGDAFGGAIAASCYYHIDTPDEYINSVTGLSISDNRTVKFQNNSAIAIEFACGGAICNSSGTKALLNNNTSLEFSENKVESLEGGDALGGAIYSEGRVDIIGNGDILFDKNTVSTVGGLAIGSAIVSMDVGVFIDNNTGTITVSGNETTTYSSFYGKDGQLYYGEIYASGAVVSLTTLSISNNVGAITFSGNKLNDLAGTKDNPFNFNGKSHNYSYRHIAGGSAIGVAGAISINDNESNVIFSDNTLATARRKGYGGAIFNIDGDITFSGNKGAVQFINNTISNSNESYGYGYGCGGAIATYREIANDLGLDLVNPKSSVVIKNNGEVLFSGNKISTAYVSLGGAIYSSNDVILSENDGVSFIDNTITNSYHACGGAIFSKGDITIEGNKGDVLFQGNTISARQYTYGGALYTYYGQENNIIIRKNEGIVSFIDNKATSATEDAHGGAIYSNADVELTENKYVLFKGNAVITTEEEAGGGAIHADGAVTISGNGDILIDKNTVSTVGGVAMGSAIITMEGGLVIENNTGTITVSGNGTTAYDSYYGIYRDEQGVESYRQYNGGMATIGAVVSLTTLSIANNAGAITFSDNYVNNLIGTEDQPFDFEGWNDRLASGGSEPVGIAGGAAIVSMSSANISNNKSDIVFSGNSVNTTNKIVLGGALVNLMNGVSINGNEGTVTFTNNSATTESSLAHGGAVATGADLANQLDPEFEGAEASVELKGNGGVSFSGNKVTAASGEAKGGAIYSSHDVVLSDNKGDVSFIGNGASGATAQGGAIYAARDLSIVNNSGDVTFRGNYVKNGDSYQLNSIHINSGKVELAAAAGKSMTFNDSIYVGEGDDIALNSYTDAEGNAQTSTGDIIFSGATTEADLKAAKGTDGTAVEIAASRTSEIKRNVSVDGGSLQVKDAAVLKINALSVAQGAGLHVGAGSSLEAADGIKLATGAALNLTGVKAATSFNMVEAAAPLANVETTVATINGDVLLNDGVTITIDGAYADLQGHNLTLTNTEDAVYTFKLDESLAHIEGDKAYFVLFTNAELTLEGAASLTDIDFTHNLSYSDVAMGYDEGTGTLFVSAPVSIPEPATATLSLLALAALAARRRRK